MKTIFKLTAVAASALLLSGCVIEDAHYSNMASGYSSSYRDNMLSGYNRDYNTHRRHHHAPSGYSSSGSAARGYASNNQHVAPSGGYSSSKTSVNRGYASSKPTAAPSGYSSTAVKKPEDEASGYASSGYSTSA